MRLHSYEDTSNEETSDEEISGLGEAFWLAMIIHSTPYMNGGATSRGVFKAYAFFTLGF